MNSKAVSRLMRIFCMSIFFLLFQCISCQPISKKLIQPNLNNHDDSLWIDPLSYDNSDEKNGDGFSEYLQNYFLNNEHEQDNRANLATPVRRANFWKRANFWRKRANFWRRDLAS